MAEPLPLRQLVEAVRADRRRRWEKGERVPVETYLQEHPCLAADPERVLDLVYDEVLLREEFGEKPLVEEYVGRFPQLAAQLQPLFEVHRAVAEGRLFNAPSTESMPQDTPSKNRDAPPPNNGGNA
jgi:hypothetical protein